MWIPNIWVIGDEQDSTGPKRDASNPFKRQLQQDLADVLSLTLNFYWWKNPYTCILKLNYCLVI